MLRVRNAKSGVVCLIELSCSCGVKTSYRNCCVINVMTCLMCLAFLPCFPEFETRHRLVVSGQWCVVNAMCGWCCVANAVFKTWVVLHRVIYGSSVACETSLCVSVYVVLWKSLRKVFWGFLTWCWKFLGWPGVSCGYQKITILSLRNACASRPDLQSGMDHRVIDPECLRWYTWMTWCWKVLGWPGVSCGYQKITILSLQCMVVDPECLRWYTWMTLGMQRGVEIAAS